MTATVLPARPAFTAAIGRRPLFSRRPPLGPVADAIDRIGDLSSTPATPIADVDGVGDRRRFGSVA